MKVNSVFASDDILDGTAALATLAAGGFGGLGLFRHGDDDEKGGRIVVSNAVKLWLGFGVSAVCDRRSEVAVLARR